MPLPLPIPAIRPFGSLESSAFLLVCGPACPSVYLVIPPHRTYLGGKGGGNRRRGSKPVEPAVSRRAGLDRRERLLVVPQPCAAPFQSDRAPATKPHIAQLSVPPR